MLADSVVAAPFVGYKRAAFLDPATPVAMSLDLVRKDLRLIAELAADVGVAIGVTAAAEVVVEAAVRRRARRRGHGGVEPFHAGSTAFLTSFRGQPGAC